MKYSIMDHSKYSFPAHRKKAKWRIRFLKSYCLATKLDFFILFLFLSGEAMAQKNEAKAIVQSNGVGIAYERSLSLKSSIQISLEGGGASERKSIWLPEEYSSGGEKISLDYRYYFLQKKMRLKGLYCSLNFSLGNYRLTYREQIGTQPGGIFGFSSVPLYTEGFKKVSTFGTGIKAGHQINFDGLIIDLGFNFFWNHVLGNSDPVILKNGSIKELRKDINGYTTILYFGLGLAF